MVEDTPAPPHALRVFENLTCRRLDFRRVQGKEASGCLHPPLVPRGRYQACCEGRDFFVLRRPVANWQRPGGEGRKGARLS